MTTASTRRRGLILTRLFDGIVFATPGADLPDATSSTGTSLSRVSSPTSTASGFDDDTLLNLFSGTSYVRGPAKGPDDLHGLLTLPPCLVD